MSNPSRKSPEEILELVRAYGQVLEAAHKLPAHHGMSQKTGVLERKPIFAERLSDCQENVCMALGGTWEETEEKYGCTAPASLETKLDKGIWVLLYSAQIQECNPLFRLIGYIRDWF
jgi:hypothetical protein